MEKAKSVSYFDIISDLEGDSFPLDESIVMLHLFGELLRDAAHWLDPKQPYTVELFNGRLDTLLSMLSVIQRTLGSASQDIHAHITAGYRLYRQTIQNKDG